MDLQVKEANDEKIRQLIENGDTTITGHLQVEAIMTSKDDVILALNVATEDGDVLARLGEFTMTEGTALTVEGCKLDLNVRLSEA